MADHGALILMAPNQVATDTVFYSWDEGLNWVELKVWSKLINIQNIITEPGNTSDKFIIYGEIDDTIDDNRGVVIILDFS
jgi:hypothetical protein